MKKSLIKFAIITSFFVFSFANAEVIPIDAVNNAYFHNNKGVNWLREGYYFGAIREFNIAIQLNPNTQATALYYRNLGETYEKIGYPVLAQTCYERALIQNPMNFDAHKSLVRTFKDQGILRAKLSEYSRKLKDPFSKITIGLIYAEMNRKADAILILQKFVNQEPDLIITKAVKNYIKKLKK